MRKYEEAMAHICVTPAMRARVLRRVRQSAARRTAWRRAAALAACLAVAVLGALVLPSVRQPADDVGGVLAPGPTQAASAEELSRLAGFQAPELDVPPFVPQQVSYSLIGDLAQVQYRAGEDTVTCRKAPGQADISGDYQTYAQTEILEIGGIPVTVRGDGGLISLATWTDGDFSFSLASSQPLAPDVWTDMLSDIIGHGG